MAIPELPRPSQPAEAIKKDVTLELTMPQETMHALDKIADLTCRREREFPRATVVQDALRTYEWILAQQVQGYTLAAIGQEEMKVLQEHPTLTGTAEALENFVLPYKVEEAKEYLLEPVEPPAAK